MVSNKPYKRSQRVAKLIHETLSKLLRTQAQDPRFANTCIEQVRLAKDLSHAKIYFSIYGDDDSTATTQALNEAAGFFQNVLSQQIELKKTPTLKFIYDSSSERGQHVKSLIQRAMNRDNDEPDGDRLDSRLG